MYNNLLQHQSLDDWDRILGSDSGGKDDAIISKVDYNVMSVAAMTLALIMMVEYVRHQLDHHAEQKPFFRAVLEGVYAECRFQNFFVVDQL
jgi:hypothetical protein